jgi:chromosome partitioning protein
MAKIVTYCNQKGGVGKTTSAVTFAVDLQRRGHSVLMFDADPQLSAYNWAGASQETDGFPVEIRVLENNAKFISKELKKYFDSYDYIIIDSPPNLENGILRRCLLISDAYVLSFIPKSLELSALPPIKAYIEDVDIMRSEIDSYPLKGGLFYNMVNNTRLVKAVIDVVESDKLFPVFNTRIRTSTLVPESQLLGLTIFEMGAKGKKLQEDFTALTDEIIELI